MFLLVTLVKQPGEPSTAFVERLAAKIQAKGSPHRDHVYRCRDITEEDLRPLVEYLVRTGQDPHCQWLRIEHESRTTSCEFWIGWSEMIVELTMNHVHGEDGEIEPDPVSFH